MGLSAVAKARQDGVRLAGRRIILLQDARITSGRAAL